MKDKIDWYKLLRVKREREKIILNNENNNENNNKYKIKHISEENKKETNIEFKNSLDNLKQKMDKLEKNINSLTDKKSFSFKVFLSKHLNIQSIAFDETVNSQHKTKTTNEDTIQNENNINKNIKNVDEIISNSKNIIDKIDIKEESSITNFSFDKNFK